MLKPLFFFFLTLPAFSAVNVEVDYNDFGAKKPVHFRRMVMTDVDRVKVVPIPNTDQEVEILVSEKLPKAMAQKMALDEAALVSLKFYQLKEDGRELISSGQVVTRWGKGALLKKFKNRGSKNPVMTLKITPQKM